ncbi:MAG: 1-deoxy-D-xylulose-5-phosphate reductoisomerase [Bacteroidetes bacterium]|nr:1-deoxy-D-xylulose-5-phosphate reductoisomerase [Bacteroidota bacterium]MCK5766495.1 1-deoxy-D-xylulose-5-phosphate reductoisomerase [Bacteroidales bacterium]
MSKKRIAILGSTGSIGIQSLDILRSHPDQFAIEALTAGNNTKELIRQAREFLPNMVVIANEAHYKDVSNALSDLDIKVFSGQESVAQIVGYGEIDMVLNAIVGFAGFEPTINALKAGKAIALANKESIVAGGELVNRLAGENHSFIIPVDSEHSAIYQCLAGESSDAVEKIFLTASGGPFREKDISALANVSPEEALKHPNWDMGDKISIDSASMMNKGLEVIEAKWLFGLKPEQIEVVIHPQSVIHSMVQFHDGSVKAQLGLPDMRLPILYALSFPGRLPSDYKRFSITDYPTLSFESPDTKKFRNLALAFEAMKAGGNIPCAMNAANEIAVRAFLEKKIGFLQMPDIIERCMINITRIAQPGFDDYVETDSEARAMALNYIRNNNGNIH